MKKRSCFLMLCLLLCSVSRAMAGNMELHFFDAGKADACLITTPESVVLIDTGKNKMGKEIVEYLDENDIDQIDAMFITHFDKDHVGGADKVLESGKVKQVFEPAYHSESKQFVQYKEALEASQAPVATLAENMTFELDGAVYKIDVANQSYYGEDEENDFSLVISIQYGENTFLFAGDAENPRLSELLAEGIGEHDVLKVPHHGKSEKLSASFFAAIRPQYSIITSDEEEPEEAGVVHALQQYGTVYLTREGSVTIVSDGSSIAVSQ